MSDGTTPKWSGESKTVSPDGVGVVVRYIPNDDESANVYFLSDSKNPKGPELGFTQAEWDAFTGGCRDGEFD
jgi:hypothetical protein